MPIPAITEFKTACWRQVRAHVEARLAELRELNDTQGLTEAQTEGIRGRIAELKLLLKLDEELKSVPTRDIYHNED
jgi:hypothetical protein